MPVLAFLTASTGAWAQTSQNAAAEALFERGRNLLEAGRVEEACQQLEASERVDPAVGVLLYLGDCYERLGRTASAWATFREAASLADQSGQAQRKEIAMTRAAALEGRLAEVEVRVEPGALVEGLEVEVGGVVIPQASWGSALPVDPGQQRVTARAPGHTQWSEFITIPLQGSAQPITVPRLRRLPSAPTPPPFADVDQNVGHTQRRAGIVVGGVGVAALAVGAVLGFRAMATNSDSESQCRPDDPGLCSQRGVELRDDASTWAMASTGTFIGGGVVTAAGLALYLLAPSSEDKNVQVGRVRPLVGRDGGGVALGGVW